MASHKALFYEDWEANRIPDLVQEIYHDDIYYWVFHDPQHLTARRDLVMVDAGANIGLVSQYALPFCDRIYALEPDTRHYQILLKTIAFNRWDRIVPINAALWTNSGTQALTRNPANTTMHSLTPSFPGETETVSTLTLSDLKTLYPLDHIDVFKIDIEGAEFSILQSEEFARLAPTIDQIVVEIHPSAGDTEALLQTLTSLGYRTNRLETSSPVYHATRL